MLMVSGNADYSVNGMARRSQSLRLGRSDGDVATTTAAAVAGLNNNNNNNNNSRGLLETRLIMEPGDEDYK
jgi:hypothetical protein